MRYELVAEEAFVHPGNVLPSYTHLRVYEARGRLPIVVAGRVATE